MAVRVVAGVPGTGCTHPKPRRCHLPWMSQTRGAWSLVDKAAQLNLRPVTTLVYNILLPLTTRRPLSADSSSSHRLC